MSSFVTMWCYVSAKINADAAEHQRQKENGYNDPAYLKKLKARHDELKEYRERTTLRMPAAMAKEMDERKRQAESAPMPPNARYAVSFRGKPFTPDGLASARRGASTPDGATPTSNIRPAHGDNDVSAELEV